MAVTLDSLEIQIAHKATGAAAEIQKVATAINHLNAALKKVIPNLQQFQGMMNTGQPINFNYNTNIGTQQNAKNIKNIHNAATKARGAVRGLGKDLGEVGKSANKSNKPLLTFLSSLKRIAMYRLLRTIIKSITQAFQEGLTNAYHFSKGIETEGHRFSEAMDQMKTASNTMKNQLGSAFISLLAALMPIINTLINLVIRFANILSQLFSAFTGSTYLKANEVPAEWAKDANKAAGAAKEWKNQLMGFDEINRLNEPSGGGGGGGADMPDYSSMFADTPLDDWAQKIHDSLSAIEFAAGEFALAIGLILTLSGTNIPLGLGLIALGAVMIAKSLKEDWSTVNTQVAETLAGIMAAASGALLAIGLILTLTGANIPLGIGLMLGGAALLAGAIALDWKAIPNSVQGVFSRIMLFVGGALLALGVLLMFATPAFSPLGLGLIIAGVAALGVGIVGLNWDSMPQKIKDVLTTIMTILGTALVVIGIILCLTGAGIPMGIGLILAGAASLGGAIALNWDGSIISAVKNVCDSIWRIISGLFKGIGEWISNLIDGILTFIGLSEQRANSAQEDGSIYLQGFASGGFPDEGQLFVAREAGAEMVGTIGGRTAVANNQEITEGIRQAVYDAMMASNNNGDRDLEVRVYLDSREIKSGQQRLNRAMGVS